MVLYFFWLLTVANENHFPVEYFEYINYASINVVKRGDQPSIYKRDYLGVEHDDEFILSFNAYNKTMALHLKPSTISREIKLTTVYDESSTEKIFRPKLFSGSVIDHHQDGVSSENQFSIASVLIKEDSFTSRNQNGDEFPITQFEGKIVIDDETYHIQTVENYSKLRKRSDAVVSDPIGRSELDKNAQLIIYKNSDMGKGKEEKWECGTDHIIHDMPEVLKKDIKLRLKKREATISPGCPGSLKELYIGTAMDCTYVAKYGGTENAKSQLLQQMDVVNQLYKTDFNILLGIIEIVSFDTCGNQAFNVACSDSYTINDRLSDFSSWRADNKDAQAGLWHLFSTCKSDPVVGLAWMSSVCTTTKVAKTDSGNTQYYSGASVSTSGTTKNDWVVIAHEIGHNFAAKHDCTKTDTCTGSTDNSCCECSTGTTCDCGGTFIMNPSSSLVFTPQDFSSCTKGAVCAKVPTIATCLVEPGLRPLLNLKVCGNGILEEGEECDNGSHPSTCCNNCTLVAPAVCDDFSHNCCTNCTIAKSTKVCRPSVGSCDITDYCDGKQKTCPSFDKFEPDGLSCTSGLNKDTYCASGQCTNRDMQCILHEVSGLSDAIKDWDPITGSCQLFKGQCDLWCDSSKLPCRKLSGTFLAGTKCGSGNGVCTKDNTCTEPDQGR
eukprot:NODE_128_length_17019_cov_0.764480.p2 type:complete len:664 gc:universal NODE_128_length_17019_cov_0.764480:6884-8875(+)